MPNTYNLNKNIYFPALTGIRAIAAYMVVIYHLAQEVPTGDNILKNAFINLSGELYIGVSIFFVLSGFLITIRYFNRVELTSNWLKRYLQNRFARIYPIYILLTIITFILMQWTPIHTGYEWPMSYDVIHKAVVVISNIFLLRAYFGDMLLIGVPTAWTLTVEETFYITAPFIFLAAKKNSYRLLLYPLISLLIGIVLVEICSEYFPYYALMANIEFMLQFTFFGRCIEFTFGIALAIIFIQKRYLFKIYRHKTAFGCVMLSILIVIFTYSQKLFYTSSLIRNCIEILLNNIIISITICIIFSGLINEKTFFRSILETRFFSLLGKSSYALYLIHLGFFNTLLIKYITDNPFMLISIYTIASIAIHKYIEQPLQMLLRSK